MSAEKIAEERSKQAIQALHFSDLEKKYLSLEKDRNTWFDKARAEQTKVSILEEETDNLKKKILDLRSELSLSKTQLIEEKEKACAISSQSKTSLERSSRMEAEADNLREEISKLTSAKRELQNQVSELETKAKLNDSSAVPLRYEIERTKKELDALSSHSRWLEDEVSNRNNQLSRSRAQHAEELMNLRQELDNVISQRDELSADLNRSVTRKTSLEKKVESLSKTMRDAREEAAAAAETADRELQAERKLVELQKQQLDSLSSSNERLRNDSKKLRDIASKNADDLERDVELAREEVQTEADKVIEAQHAEYTKEVDQLKEKLRKFEESHDDKFFQLQGGKEASDGDKTMGVTDLHIKLYETEDKLKRETSERKKLATYIIQIEGEIAAKTPVLLRQKREYEDSIRRQDDMQNRLRDALSEMRNSKEETQEVRDELNRMQRKNDDLVGENTDLAGQVQALLTSKAGGNVPEGVPTTISEIQKQNQHLLGENRRLSGQVSEFQDKLRNDPKILRVERLEKELETLREERVRHETLVGEVVQQRDLYRALLNKQDGSPDEMTNTDLVVAKNSKSIRMAEDRCKRLEEDLAKTRADVTAAEGDKKMMLQRVERYATHNDELTLSIGKLRNELSKSNANFARSEAEASYHIDRCLRVETTLDETREEIKRIQNLKNETQSLCSNLQKQVTEGNAKISKYENDIKQAEMKLRLKETEVQTAKAGESRLNNENCQLRTEITRQGVLLESVQRIEASLIAKNEEERSLLKEENSRVKELLEQERSKHKVDLENSQSQVKEKEVELMETIKSKEQALENFISLKQEADSAAIERQKVEANMVSLGAEIKSLRDRVKMSSGDAEASLKEKLVILDKELKEAKCELLSAKERGENFQKLAKDREQDLKLLLKGNEEFKKEKENEMQLLEGKITEMKCECTKKDTIISEFARDLSSHRDEQKKAEATLRERIGALETQLDNANKDITAANIRSTKISSELEKYKNDSTESKNNYERELDLHAHARADLREVREQIVSEKRLRKSAEEKLNVAMIEISEKESQMDNEKSEVKANLKEMEESLKQSRMQNELLHSQLKTLGDQVEKTQLNRIQVSTDESESTEEVTVLQKNVSELREITNFLKSERDMCQSQLEAARRTAERERAVSTVIKRSLDEARAELRLLETTKASKDSDKSSADMSEKLKSAEEQSILLRESNKLLRDEGSKLQELNAKLETQLSEEKDAMKPIMEREKKLMVEKAALESERQSLRRECNDWKDRVQSLVSKFNQVDPEVHERVLKDMEMLRKQCNGLKGERESAEKEVTSAKTLVAKLNKDLSQQKAMVQKHQILLKKMNADKEAASKTTAITKERDQLKEKYKKMETELTSAKTELKGANDRVDFLKKHLRQFQKTNAEYRKKISSLEASSSDPKTEKQSEIKEESKGKDDSTSIGQSKTTKENNNNEELPSVPETGFRFGPSSSKKVKTADKKIEIVRKVGKEAVSKVETLSKKQKVLARKEDGAKKESTTKQEPPVKKQKVLEKDEIIKKETSEVNKQEEKEQGTGQILKEKLLKKQQEANALKEKLRKRKMDKQSAEEKSQKRGTVLEAQSKDDLKAEKKSTEEESDIQEDKKDGNNQADKTSQQNFPTVDNTTDEKSKLQSIGINNPFGGTSFSNSTASFGNSSFGKPPAATGGSIFGSSVRSEGFGGTTSTVTGMGAAKKSAGTSSVFLDMKPPSSSAAPFSFGSTSIKLPTPTPISSSTGTSPFGAFTGKTFGSGGGTPTSKPLFGTSPSIKLSSTEINNGDQGSSCTEVNSTEKNESQGNDLEKK